jgi:hypothetical protein
MNKIYNIKKTISVKYFISEFGENFSEHMKERLLELEIRCVLVRKEENYILNLKHVQHTQYPCNKKDASDLTKKEYTYGQFIVVDGILYFSEKCTESNTVMESPIVSLIYSALENDGMISESGKDAKKIDDSNIDFVVDSILTVCPNVSQEYIDIVKGMISRSRK